MYSPNRANQPGVADGEWELRELFRCSDQGEVFTGSGNFACTGRFMDLLEQLHTGDDLTAGYHVQLHQPRAPRNIPPQAAIAPPRFRRG